MPNLTVDRTSIRLMAEDLMRTQFRYHRNLIATRPDLGPQQTKDAAEEHFLRLVNEINTQALLMPADERDAFTKIFNEEIDFLDEELERDPARLGQRLGLDITTPVRTGRPAGYRRQGLGELAVRTAVRATIWETIWLLLRR